MMIGTARRPHHLRELSESGYRTGFFDSFEMIEACIQSRECNGSTTTLKKLRGRCEAFYCQALPLVQ